MTMLSKNELNKLLEGEQPLVEGFVDEELQLQPNGIELTLESVHRLNGKGIIDFDNSQRQIPESIPLDFNEEWIELEKGIYKIIFNEIVNIPKNLAALATPRSSLIRAGATLETAVWDAGYRGRSECLLVVYNPNGLKLQKNARLIQLVFYTLHTEVTEGYDGKYQNENTCSQ